MVVAPGPVVGLPLLRIVAATPLPVARKHHRVGAVLYSHSVRRPTEPSAAYQHARVHARYIAYTYRGCDGRRTTTTNRVRSTRVKRTYLHATGVFVIRSFRVHFRRGTDIITAIVGRRRVVVPRLLCRRTRTCTIPQRATW